MGNVTLNRFKLVYLAEVVEKINREISSYQEKLDNGGLSSEQEARILHTINALSRLNENLMRWDE